jgi:hypothetical protein
MSRSKFVVTTLASILGLALACSRQSSQSPTAPTSHAAATAADAADGSTLKADPPVLVSPLNDAQMPDNPTLTAKPTKMDFDGRAPDGLFYRIEVYNAAGTKIIDTGLLPQPTYQITQKLEYQQRHTWRARAEYQGRATPWSQPASFISFSGGYIRGDEVYDPLYNGVTVGEIVNDTTFLPDQGLRLNTNISYVKYLIPTTITAGEFSMEVMGLQPNIPGDKSKVFAMSSGADDFITDPYRFDVQYRGSNGSPPNAITFRMLWGSADDPNLRYEPDTTTRFNSIYLLDPNIVYFFKATWGRGEVRLVVRENGVNGKNIYEVAVPARLGTYNPMPHYAFIGAPPGRSGAESATVPGTIFRKVWISSRPRPAL